MCRAKRTFRVRRSIRFRQMNSCVMVVSTRSLDECLTAMAVMLFQKNRKRYVHCIDIDTESFAFYCMMNDLIPDSLYGKISNCQGKSDRTHVTRRILFAIYTKIRTFETKRETDRVEMTIIESLLAFKVTERKGFGITIGRLR